jgi:hypothetical protein
VYNFNDPFEGLFRYKVSSDYPKFKEFYLNHFSGRPEKLDYYFNNKIEFEKLINKTFDYRFENNAVCCFSDESNLTDVLMWANYADDHKGICLVFDSAQLKFEPKGKKINGTFNPTGPFEITYSDKYLDLDPLNRELNQDSFLTTKFCKWLNEKEYRYISAKPGSYYFSVNSLVKIVFGLRISPDSKETIKKIVDNRYDNVKYNQIDLLEDRFGFSLKE